MILQESGEMYLETILILSQEKDHVRSLDIANHLGYSKPSVSRAVGLLKTNRYINVDVSGFITLTESGLEIANKIYERHEVLKKAFENMGVPSNIAEEDACRIEHVISDCSFEAVKRFVEES